MLSHHTRLCGVSFSYQNNVSCVGWLFSGWLGINKHLNMCVKTLHTMLFPANLYCAVLQILSRFIRANSFLSALAIAASRSA